MVTKLLYLCREQTHRNMKAKEHTEQTAIEFKHNTGGREKYFKKLNVGDCVCRSIAIAAQLDYNEVYKGIPESCCSGSGNARNGINTHLKSFKKYMRKLGFKYVDATKRKFGLQGVRMRTEDMPSGRIVVCMRTHYAAVIDGVLNDTWNCSLNGKQRIDGYWEYTK